MPTLIHHLISSQLLQCSQNTALVHKKQQFSYSALHEQQLRAANGFVRCGLKPSARVAIYLPKLPETVFSIFGSTLAGGVFVPINPLLKPQQVAYILADCNVQILVTTQERLALLEEILPQCRELQTVVVLGEIATQLGCMPNLNVISWQQLTCDAKTHILPQRIDTDMAAILYTSGSTGDPKGVVLSHRNMVAGAESVAEYLKNSPSDRILAVLPFSFDAGLSQLTTAFSVGATVVLMDYLLPRDVIRAIDCYQITGLAAVPPLWNQLVQLDWPQEAAEQLRYITNTGGAMPLTTTKQFRKKLPNTDIYLMYGLTEAFRSTYLPPDQVDIRPDSIGKAIPNAEVLVVREDGSECAVGEPGELVHKGALVAMGYWNSRDKTAERFKPAPNQTPGLILTELAVWSGDQVVRDEEGYLYFINRKDEMIKTSGYRVSPTEVESVVYETGLVDEVVALGIPHSMLGQVIVLVAKIAKEGNKESIAKQCKKELPNFMLPKEIVLRSTLPRNQNGKIDRKALFQEFQNLFQEQQEE